MRLDRLPRSITGFFERGDALRSFVNPGAFKRACRLVAQIDKGVVEDIGFDLSGGSYYAATLKTKTDHLSVLCNSSLPYLGFVRPRCFGLGNPDLTYVAPVGLAAAFSAVTEFKPLDADWLSGELTAEMLLDLSAAELDQLAYWKPWQIGQVIFNSWD